LTEKGIESINGRLLLDARNDTLIRYLLLIIEKIELNFSSQLLTAGAPSGCVELEDAGTRPHPGGGSVGPVTQISGYEIVENI